MKNYFNAIGVADMEKVHSAMIAWILDDSNDLTLSSPSSSTSNFSTFDLQERSRLLCDLFGVTPARTFKSIISHVEWNDIDIMIETTDNNNVNEIWVIENKLKSQEHMSNVKNTNGISSIWQTLKYEIIIDSSFPKLSKHFMLLSLGGDKAKSSSGRWHAYKYDGIQNLLLSVASIKNHVLIEEYANAVSEMTQELSKFLNASDYRNYPNVFKKIKKSQKTTSLQQNKVKPTEKYIVENGLETIFQKQLLAKLVKDKLPQICNSVHYDERNGIAMFVCPVCCIGNDYDLSIEFQGGTYKVALLHKDYMSFVDSPKRATSGKLLFQKILEVEKQSHE